MLRDVAVIRSQPVAVNEASGFPARLDLSR